MDKITKTELKNIFFNKLTPYFTEKGYKKYLTSGDPGYNLSKDGIVLHFFFNFYSDGSIGCSTFCITHYEVEDYVLNIGIPTNALIEHRKKEKYHLPTVELRRLPEVLKRKPLRTAAEIEAFASAYIDYHSNEASAFMKKYSYLPNILEEMDRLRSEGKYWKEILGGGPKHLVSGIIISKLCNDIHFEEKLNWLEELFKTMPTDWLPYWKKYKERLKGIKPKYNLG